MTRDRTDTTIKVGAGETSGLPDIERGMGSVKRLEFDVLPREGGRDYMYLLYLEGIVGMNFASNQVPNLRARHSYKVSL
jgi:hypothetical protein